MNDLIKLVIKYKTDKSDLIFEVIVEKFKLLIISKMKEVPKYYRDDFYQELLECLLKVINTINISNSKIIDVELFTIENLELLEKHNFKNINKVLKNEFLFNFIVKFGVELFVSSFYSMDKLSLFLYEFNLFCNENQFINYVNVSFDSLVCLFYRRRKKIKKLKLISLDMKVNEEVNLIDLIAYPEQDDENMFYDESLLTKRDLEFLNLFYVDDRILKKKELAEKMKVSPQAVSIRLKRIKNRYRKAFDNKYRKV